MMLTAHTANVAEHVGQLQHSSESALSAYVESSAQPSTCRLRSRHIARTALHIFLPPGMNRAVIHKYEASSAMAFLPRRSSFQADSWCVVRSLLRPGYHVVQGCRIALSSTRRSPEAPPWSMLHFCSPLRHPNQIIVQQTELLNGMRVSVPRYRYKMTLVPTSTPPRFMDDAQPGSFVSRHRPRSRRCCRFIRLRIYSLEVDRFRRAILNFAPVARI